MKRRELIAIIGGGALAATPLRAAERMVGWISVESREATAPFLNALKAGLQIALPPGGDGVAVADRYVAGGPEAVAQQVAELQKQGAALIVAQGAATLPVVRAKPAVPVVFAFSADPVVAGIAQSLARPGGNATGVTFMSLELNTKRIDLLRRALPDVRRVALLSNARHAGEENEIATSQRTAQQVGIDLKVFRSQSADDILPLVGQALDAGTEALIMLSSSPMVQRAPAVVAQCLPRKVPVISGWSSIARSGALMTYGPNLQEMYRRVGAYVVRVLGGAAPGNLPIEQPTTFELVINGKTASALGLTLPPSLLAQADEVIE
jgi:putative ABC transport system substrate-binding protein